jgi:hypothetical protein
MGRDVNTISVTRFRDGETDVEYIRPDDQSVWKIRCKVEGDRVIWRGIDSFGPGSGLGRWRDGPSDPRITVGLAGARVRVAEAFEPGDEPNVTIIDVPD